jgi:hypothetical protein
LYVKENLKTDYPADFTHKPVGEGDKVDFWSFDVRNSRQGRLFGFFILLYGQSTSANIEHRFNEGVLETLLGVSTAYVFGIVIPNLMSRFRSKERINQ